MISASKIKLAKRVFGPTIEKKSFKKNIISILNYSV